MRKVSSFEREQSPESEAKELPVVSAFIFRHGEALTKHEDPNRPLSKEGEGQIDKLGESLVEELGDPSQYLINVLDARNTRARESTTRLVEYMNDNGFGQYFVPIKTSNGGIRGDETLKVSDKPREHRTHPGFAKKIFAKEVDTPDGKKTKLVDHYKEKLKNEGLESPTEFQIIQAWLTDSEPLTDVETPQEVKAFFKKAIERTNNQIPALKKILPEGKSIVTLLGANNPRVDLLIETLSGMELSEQDEEIVSNAEGCRIDFYPNRPPVVSVFGEKLEKKFDYKSPTQEKNKQIIDSLNTDEQDLSPQEAEQLERLKVGASNVIKCFDLKRSSDNKKGENLLIVTDTGADQLMIKALYESGREAAHNDCRLVVLPKTEHAGQSLGEAVGEKMKSADAILLLTTFSRSHSDKTVESMKPPHDANIISQVLQADSMVSLRNKYSSEQLADRLSKRKIRKESEFPSKARIISITNTNLDTLTEGGALEDPAEIVERVEKFSEIIKDVEKVRVTSDNGTDLIVDLKVSSFGKETGVIDQPGQVANFPSGECYSGIDLAGTNGVLVVDGSVGMIGAIDEPIKITIKNGIAVKIEGGKEADKLNGILEKAQHDYQEDHHDDKTTSAFRTAEFAFGMNTKAFRYTPDGQRISPPTSLEGEKGLGTIHVALGKNTFFKIDKSDPDYNDIPIHIDLIAMNTNVVGIDSNEEEIELIKNGQMVCL